jgi:hypothetical protein
VLKPNAQQMGCGSGSNCTVNLKDGRIMAAQISKSNEAGSLNPVLATSFATGLAAPNAQTQNLWFLQDVASINWLIAFAFVGSGQWFAYPTISIDNDADIYLGSTNFQPTIFPQTIWDAYKGFFSSQFVGQNILEPSGGAYTGIAGKSECVGATTTQ